MRSFVLIAIVLAAIAIRAAVGLGLESRTYFPDSDDFIQIAHNILDGQGPRLNEQTLANRGPGYSYFIASMISIFGDGEQVPFRAIRLTQALLGGLLGIVVYLIAAALFSRGAGIAAAVLVAADPFLTYFSALLLTETIFSLLLALGLLCMIRMATRNDVDQSDIPWPCIAGWSLAAGLALGASTLVRPAALLILVPLCIVWVAAHKAQPKALLSAVAVVAVVFAAMLPWAIRNQRQTGRMVFTTLSSGASLYEGVFPGADGGPGFHIIEEQGWPTEIDGAGEVAKDDLLKKRSWEIIRDDPVRIGKLGVVKLLRFWSIFPNDGEHRSIMHMLASAGWMVPIMVLIAAGLWQKRRMLWGAAAILLVPAIYFTALHTLFVGSIRYRAPVMPLLAVFGGVALATGCQRFVEQRNKKKKTHTTR